MTTATSEEIIYVVGYGGEDDHYPDQEPVLFRTWEGAREELLGAMDGLIENWDEEIAITGDADSDEAERYRSAQRDVEEAKERLVAAGPGTITVSGAGWDFWIWESYWDVDGR